MKYKIIPVMLLAAIASSCGTTNSKTGRPFNKRDTLGYTMQTIKERANDCGTLPDSGCTTAIYAYPVFKDKKALNDTINHTLVNFLNSTNNPDTSLRKLAVMFINAYYGYKKTYPNKPMIYKMRSNSKVLRQDSSLTVVEANIFVSMSGAAGYITRYINWDVQTNKKIVLDDLFEAGYNTQLNITAEGIFRRNEHLSDTEPLSKYLFANHRFALNDNFQITPYGIEFLYNQNEIKPHEAGATHLFIPYSAVKSILKPNTVLARFIK